MAHHHDIDFHRLDVAERIDERLAFFYAGVGACEIHRIGRESLFGEFKTGAGTGAVFKEKVHDRKAAQRGHLLDGTFQNFTELLGIIQNGTDILLGHPLEPKQMLDLQSAHLILHFYEVN